MTIKDLSEYLDRFCKGQENAVSGTQLCEILHTSEKELQKHVNMHRSKGIPIGSSKNGYFYAQHAGELYDTIRNLEKMRDGLDRTISGLENTLRHFPYGVRRLYER